MNLEKYISTLLFSHDCVIVPEFGAFLANKVSSVLKENSIYPPSRQLGFNAALKNSDGLLIQTVAQENNLNFEDARHEVENQISFWKNHLERNNSLSLNHLGTISKNASGSLEFNSTGENYLLESFGLESVRAKYIMQSVPENGRSNAIWWKAASVIPILLGGYLYFAKPQPVANFVNEQWSGFVTPFINSQIIKEEAPVALIKAEEPKIEVTEEIPVTESVVLENTIYDYQVIAGSFRVESEANTLELKLKEKGFENARFTQKKGSYFYVAFETFQTKEEALEFRKTVGEEYPEAWVLSLKD